jgi:hypothetical protein
MFETDRETELKIYCAVVAGVNGGDYVNRQDVYYQTIDRNYGTALAVWQFAQDAKAAEIKERAKNEN